MQSFSVPHLAYIVPQHFYSLPHNILMVVLLEKGYLQVELVCSLHASRRTMVGLCNDPLTSLLNSRFECVPIHSRVQFCFHGNLGMIQGPLIIVLVDRKYKPDLVVMGETTRFNVVIDEISEGHMS